MKSLPFFDANLRLGRAGGNGADLPELLREMDRYGVDRALVRHMNLATLGSPVANAELASMLRDDSAGRLVGVWCILPTQCEELPAPAEFFAQMRQNRIGAITLSPFDHRFIPTRSAIGGYMRMAAERRVPVLLDAFAGRWRELYEFVREFPENILIYVESVGKWGSDRNIRPLLENYENFHFESSGYWVPEGIADLVKRYGDDRILYGSGFPRYNQGSGMLQLKHSTLDASSIAKIAGGNLQRLLNGATL